MIEEQVVHSFGYFKVSPWIESGCHRTLELLACSNLIVREMQFNIRLLFYFGTIFKNNKLYFINNNSLLLCVDYVLGII